MLITESTLESVTNAVRAAEICVKLKGPIVQVGDKLQDVWEQFADEDMDMMETPCLVVDPAGDVQGVLWLETMDTEDPIVTEAHIDRVTTCPGTASAMDLALLLHEQGLEYCLIGSRRQPSGVVMPSSLWNPAFRVVLLTHLLRLESILLTALLQRPDDAIRHLRADEVKSLRGRARRNGPTRSSRNDADREATTAQLLDLASFEQRLRMAATLRLVEHSIPTEGTRTRILDLRNKLAHPTANSCWEVFDSGASMLEAVSELRRLALNQP